MRLLNIKVGDWTVKDILEDLKSIGDGEGSYEQCWENMRKRIDYYLEEIE